MKNSQLTVEQILTEDKYIIPRYQRNYAWEREDIEQLVKDIISAQIDDLATYYIGIMVVSKERDAYTIIDGQQRITTLLLIALALKNKNDNRVIHINKDVLRFQSRSTSNEVLEKLIGFSKSNESNNTDEENELNRAFGNVKDILEEHLPNKDDSDTFQEYLLKKVKVFRDVMPENLDLNLYFERFNSRGKQLESHEIIKGIFIGKLEKQSKECEENKLSRRTFAEIWDVCSDMTSPIYFNPKGKAELLSVDNLNNKYDEFFRESEVTESNDSVKPLRKVLNSKRDISYVDSTDDQQKLEKESNEVTHVDYRSVINFSTFLLHVFHFKEGNDVKDVTLDDKKLLDIFKANQRDSDWICKFTETLVKLRLLYDNYIIKALVDKDFEDGRKWIIDPFFNNDESKETLKKEKQSEIRMLQALFAETFTANSDTKWLYEVLNYLSEKVFIKNNCSNEEELDKGLKNKLREMTVSYAEDRICKDDDKSKIDENKLSFYEETEGFRKVPIYAFNFTDYVLWENRETLKEEYSKKAFEDKYEVDFDNFEFRSRKSIEHWYPQNPVIPKDIKQSYVKFPTEDLNSFGNLALVTASHNSTLSNRLPKDKIKNSNVKFENQSLKLQIMVHHTDREDWNAGQVSNIKKMEKKIITLMDEYIEKVNNMKDHD